MQPVTVKEAQSNWKLVPDFLAGLTLKKGPEITRGYSASLGNGPFELHVDKVRIEYEDSQERANQPPTFVVEMTDANKRPFVWKEEVAHIQVGPWFQQDRFQLISPSHENLILTDSSPAPTGPTPRGSQEP